MTEGLRSIKIKNIPTDIISGIVIALVSIPISMGYAQISGLPAIYGLYGSLIPVLVFALMTSTKTFIFGVDAAPAALTGGAIASLGIISGTTEAVKAVPVITTFVAVWLLLLRFLKAGKLTQYVSEPVMGGFISGICTTIIVMQIPKLFGGYAITGEIQELIPEIYMQIRNGINTPSLILGLLTIAIILTFKKITPKIPVNVILMIVIAFIEYKTKICSINHINLLDSVEKGLGTIQIPDFTSIPIGQSIITSGTIAVVIVAETLLAQKSFASQENYKVNSNNEISTFAFANLASALVGCCPVNGSVSRTSMNKQFGGKSQITSIVAVITMGLILMFATGFIQYLPVPVLTAIVICALLGAIEFDLAKKLHKTSKKELRIFTAAFIGVLVFGTIYGVLIGVILSFINVIIRLSNPPRSFLGVINGREGFFNMHSNKNARPIKNVILYKFSTDLFFANVSIFIEDIENAITDTTQCVIIDAAGIGSIDTSAAKAVEELYQRLKQRGINLYITEQHAALNKQLRQLGLAPLMRQGLCRRRMDIAMRAEGIKAPYELEHSKGMPNDRELNIKEHLLIEFEWAFGDSAEEELDRYSKTILERMHNNVSNEKLLYEMADMWNGMTAFDEDVFLETLQLHIEYEESIGTRDTVELSSIIEEKRQKIHERTKERNEKEYEKLREHRRETINHIKKNSPQVYEELNRGRELMKKRLEERDNNKE